MDEPSRFLRRLPVRLLPGAGELTALCGSAGAESVFRELEPLACFVEYRGRSDQPSLE